MKFYNHCALELYNEANKIISPKKWFEAYKDQLLTRVKDILENGKVVNTKTGLKTIPFKISDIEDLISAIVERDRQ